MLRYYSFEIILLLLGLIRNSIILFFFFLGAIKDFIILSALLFEIFKVSLISSLWLLSLQPKFLSEPYLFTMAVAIVVIVAVTIATVTIVAAA